MYTKITESNISFPSADLPLDIWDKTVAGYILKPALKTKILSALSEYPELDLLDIADKIHVVGSIGTNLYDEDADIDIHIVPEISKLPQVDLTEVQKDIMKWFKNNRDENNWFVNAHPFEVYLQLDPLQDYYSDTIYDLLNDEWLKPYKKVDQTYNPYEVYSSIFDELKRIAAPADLEIGELRRDVIDYKRVIIAIKKAPLEVKQGLENYLKSKLEEIELDITSVIKNKEIWRQIRRRNSNTVTDITQDLRSLKNSDTWLKDNAIFKLLDRYAYMRLIADLSEIIDKGDVTEKDIPKIEDILKDFINL